MSAQETGRKGGKTGTGRRETHKSKRVQRPNRSSRGRHHKGGGRRHGDGAARASPAGVQFRLTHAHFSDEGQINTDVLGYEAASRFCDVAAEKAPAGSNGRCAASRPANRLLGRELLKAQLCLKTGEEEKRLLCNFRSDRDGTAGTHAQSAWQVKRKLHI